MTKRILPRTEHTNALIWLIAIVCTVLAVTTIFTGLLVIIIYIIYQPKMPYLIVTEAHLNNLGYDQSGLLDSVITLSVVAENDNTKAHAKFSELSMKLEFEGIELAELRADDFEVEKNSTVPLNYVVASGPVPLDERGMEVVDASLKRDLIKFELFGQARTRWRVGFIPSVKFWTHLACEIQFSVSNGSTNGLDCNSKSHSL